jgi:putative transposase
MPSTWTQNFYHAVYSTKDRVELITPDIEPRLYAFVGGILKDLGCVLYEINGMPDHLHALIRYPAALSHSDMLRHMKARSTKWLHESFPHLSEFAWQEGYGGFTVSKSEAPRVGRYIARQKEHHKRMTFKEEFLELLRLHGIEYDEDEVFK